MLSAGKLWGMRRMSVRAPARAPHAQILMGSVQDREGRFKMVATDQRPPIMNVVKKHSPDGTASYDNVAAIKELLVKSCAEHATALLLDPVWGYPVSHGHLRPDKGL